MPNTLHGVIREVLSNGLNFIPLDQHLIVLDDIHDDNCTIITGVYLRVLRVIIKIINWSLYGIGQILCSPYWAYM